MAEETLDQKINNRMNELERMMREDVSLRRLRIILVQSANSGRVCTKMIVIISKRLKTALTMEFLGRSKITNEICFTRSGVVPRGDS